MIFFIKMILIVKWDGVYKKNTPKQIKSERKKVQRRNLLSTYLLFMYNYFMKNVFW
jgi:hypothetical protein